MHSFLHSVVTKSHISIQMLISHSLKPCKISEIYKILRFKTLHKLAIFLLNDIIAVKWLQPQLYPHCT